MDYAPIARIILRYVVGVLLGMDADGIIAANPDLITIVAVALGAAVESFYAWAKKKGWAT
jgi:hypothetical protein